MKQIYNFEQKEPPVVNEAMLHDRIEQKRSRRITVLLALSSFLLLLGLLLLALLAYEFIPIVLMICAGYVGISVPGSCIITIVFTQKGGYWNNVRSSDYYHYHLFSSSDWHHGADRSLCLS